MRLTRTTDGPVLERDGEHLGLDDDWDALFRRRSLGAHLRQCRGRPVTAPTDALAPVGNQEVWAAGVTYYVSRDARMEESAASGGADVYERCYDAERPELFLKATPHRVAGPGQPVRIRSDSRWNVPEPELVMAITSHGEVFGYTVGNDVSSRDIEGENPLYLPQAKVYDGCAALGPSIAVAPHPPAADTRISLDVRRDDVTCVQGDTTVSRIRRGFDELVDYLRRDNSFPDGCFLMTGTGIVPPPEFTLRPDDVVTITIEGIGTLSNPVVQAPRS